MRRNLLLLTDSYKYSHPRQLPSNTTHIYSYLESRGGKFDATVFFGLQYILKEYLVGEVLTWKHHEQAAEFCLQHFGSPDVYNWDGIARLITKHSGRLPVSIRAVPEGTVVPTHNVLMTVENTDPEFPWLTNFLETLLLQVWYPTTVATLSRQMCSLIGHYLERTGDPSGLPYKLHDFGERGVSSMESAAIGGAAHLVNSRGTDNVPGIMLARQYYAEECAGFSIPAAEHSTITSWGREHETAAYLNMLTQFPKGFVAVVSDSYDIYRACEHRWGEELREEVLNRNGTLVIRPDSGYPPEVVVKCLNILGERFGQTRNIKGFKVLDPHVRLLQGDGIDLDMAQDILNAMAASDWSADNIAFGMGGALLQQVNRDTQKFAFKCSAVKVDGEWRDVYKNPVTDPGKESKRGRLQLRRSGNSLTTVREDKQRAEQESDDQLVEVFCDGKLLMDQPFEEIRKRAKIY